MVFYEPDAAVARPPARRSSGRPRQPEGLENGETVLVRLRAAEGMKRRGSSPPVSATDPEEVELEKAVAARRKTLAPAPNRAEAVKKAAAALPEIEEDEPPDPFAPTAPVASGTSAKQKLIEAVGGPEALLALRAELAVRMIQWLEADVPSALACVGERNGPPDPFAPVGKAGGLFGKIGPALKLWAEELPEDQGAALIQRTSYDIGQEIARGMATHAASKGDADFFARVMNAAAAPSVLADGPADPFAPSPATVSSRPWVLEGITAWPYEKLDSLVAIAAKRGDADFLRSVLMRLSPADLCAKVKSLLDSPEEAKAFAAGDFLYTMPAHMHADELIRRMNQNRAMPLAERQALCLRLLAACASARELSAEDTDKDQLEYADSFKPTPEKLAGHLAAVLERLDLDHFTDDGAADALAHAFLAGEMDARQTRAAMLAAISEEGTPPLDEEDLVIDPLLSAVDPVPALALLDGLSPEERFGRTIVMANHWPFRPTPQQFFAFQQALSRNLASEDDGAIREMWKSFTKDEDGDWYRKWVPSLPAGPVRDAALSALAARIEPEDPDRAGALRAMRSEPEREDEGK